MFNENTIKRMKIVQSESDLRNKTRSPSTTDFVRKQTEFKVSTGFKIRKVKIKSKKLENCTNEDAQAT